MYCYSPIGIDIHSNGIHALQLKTDRRECKVSAVASIPAETPLDDLPDRTDILKTLIRALMDHRMFKGRQAVVCLPHTCQSAFPVTMDAVPRQAFDAALARACGQQLSYPLDQAVIDYFSVEPLPADAEQKVRVTVVSARRAEIERVIRAIGQAGVKPRVIDYDLGALIRVHGRIQALGDAPSVLIHMEHGVTVLAVVTKTHIVAHRHLDWGVGRLHDRIAETLHLDRESDQPRSMLTNYGVDYDALHGADGGPAQNAAAGPSEKIAALRVVSQILVPNMEELVQEIFQIIGYARSLSPETRFKELCLYGMANAIKNLGPFLEKRLHIPTRSMAPFQLCAPDSLSVFGSNELNDYTRALGLAIREAA